MKKLQQKVAIITQSRTSQSFQKAIDFLFKIIKELSAPSSTRSKKIKENDEQIIRRSYTEKKQQKNAVNRDMKIIKQKIKNSKLDNCENTFIKNGEQMKGSRITIAQCLQKQIAGHEYLQKRQPKLNKRGLQQTIQIYHQCLFKTIQIAKKQYIKIRESLGLEPIKRIKLQQFCEKYQLLKKNCKTFDDLIRVSHQFLALQFLQAMNSLQIYNKEKKVNEQKQKTFHIFFH